MNRTGTATQAEADTSPAPKKPPGPKRITSVEVLAAIPILLVIFRGPIAAKIAEYPLLQIWTTVFVSVMVQAMPFLVFGVAPSAVIAVYVPRSFSVASAGRCRSPVR